MSLNIFGQPILTCSNDPLTGFYRDGCCTHSEYDQAMHTVCAVISEGFLSFSKAKGNDLSTPRPAFDFPGLKPGDRWCLCALRWLEAYEEGVAPEVILEATNEATLDVIPMDVLIQSK